MLNSKSALASVLAMAAAAMPAANPAGVVTPAFRFGRAWPTNKGGRRPATKPARPRRTRAQKLRTQARRAKASYAG